MQILDRFFFYVDLPLQEKSFPRESVLLGLIELVLSFSFFFLSSRLFEKWLKTKGQKNPNYDCTI